MPEPKIDPITGKPIEETQNNPQGVTISAEEWGMVKGKLDVFERTMVNRPSAPQTPPVPQGPTVAQQITEIDNQIAALDAQIDTEITAGRGVSKLLKERSALERKITRLQIKSEDIDPALSVGMQTIDQISDTVTRANMPHLSLVKDDYERALQSIPVEQRMNPAMRQAAYNIAVGQNINKIMEAEREKTLRESNNNPNPPPNNTNARKEGKTETGGVPKPEDVLSKDALQAIKFRNMTVDEYYRKMGHKDGWKGFWEKSGKTYFGETNAD